MYILLAFVVLLLLYVGKHVIFTHFKHCLLDIPTYFCPSYRSLYHCFHVYRKALEQGCNGHVLFIAFCILLNPIRFFAPSSEHKLQMKALGLTVNLMQKAKVCSSCSTQYVCNIHIPCYAHFFSKATIKA